MEHKTYRAFCVNDECGHFMNKSWAFKPSFVENEVCPKCNSKYEVREVEDESNTTSSGIINNRGEFHTRLSGEFRDLLRSIKRGSPHNNMKDY